MFANKCIAMQSRSPNIQESEDCLYLNVYAPEREEPEKLLPVMVFIHGGYFVWGSSNVYAPEHLVTVGQVIVVTINYRLGVWGFLSTEDSSAPGNYGLWDQRLAVLWVKNNIRSFGGDSSRITLFGESAGAASVIYQGLFPANKGLFQRIIAQSGSASSYWAVNENIKNTTERFAVKVGCYNTNAVAMVDCLRELPLDTINNTIHDISSGDVFNFVPSIDNDFVTCNPGDLLNTELDTESFQAARKALASYDLLMGINNGEGVLDLQPSNGYGDLETFVPNKTYFDTILVPALVKNALGAFDISVTTRVENAIREKYTDKNASEDDFKIREQIISMWGDVEFLAPTHSTLQMHAKFTSRNSFMYYVNFVPVFHVLPTPSWFKGANHADELLYMFRGAPLTEDVIKLTRDFVTMWSNFAKSGNPSQPVDIGLTWKPYTAFHHRYLEITRDMDQTNMRICLHEDRAEFWNVDIPDIIGTDVKECNHRRNRFLHMRGTPWHYFV